MIKGSKVSWNVKRHRSDPRQTPDVLLGDAGYRWKLDLESIWTSPGIQNWNHGLGMTP